MSLFKEQLTERLFLVWQFRFNLTVDRGRIRENLPLFWHDYSAETIIIRNYIRLFFSVWQKCIFFVAKIRLRKTR